jgi:hypothetical protein
MDRETLKMTTETITYILGALASAGFISANYVLNRKTSILLLIAASAILVIQFGPVMGLWGLAALNLLFIIRNISFNIKKLEPYYNSLLWVWLTILYVAYVVITLFDGGFNLLTSIPLFAILFNTLALAQKQLIGLKLFLTLNSLTWVVFDIIGGLWGNLIGDIFGFIAGSIAIFRILNPKADKKAYGEE